MTMIPQLKYSYVDNLILEAKWKDENTFVIEVRQPVAEIKLLRETRLFVRDGKNAWQQISVKYHKERFRWDSESPKDSNLPNWVKAFAERFLQDEMRVSPKSETSD